jgi:ABC-type antimicrobial peptide transport system permease subunit
MSYAVTLRTREIGIRMALGSQREAILRLVVHEAIRLTLIGIAIGIPPHSYSLASSPAISRPERP